MECDFCSHSRVGSFLISSVSLDSPSLFRPFLSWNEKISGGHSHFITGAGGFLQNVLAGYMGISIRPDGLYIAPTPLSGVDNFSTQIFFQQMQLQISIRALRVDLKSSKDNTISFLVCSPPPTRCVPLAPGTALASLTAPVLVSVP